MKDQDYIREAANLADGWSYGTKYDPFADMLYGPQRILCTVSHHQPTLDALAAQLVRQVDSLPADDDGKVQCVVGRGSVLLEVDDPSEPFGHRNLAWLEGPDRTMNTIKAIVDSGILTTVHDDQESDE
ncbi:MAG: hypothetical protein QNJ14_19515 [Woeseiaceae bacterium]|nr:hypothetical protein [Woeseiaceae bacterium]